MKTEKSKAIELPEPFTPGATKGMVRPRAKGLFRDKLPRHPLILEDRILAQKDLVNSMQAEQAES